MKLERVRQALRYNQLETLELTGPEVVALLLELTRPQVESILRERALRQLGQLPTAAQREAFCEALIAQDWPQALPVAIEAEYRPQDLARRALFYFVTEQWAAYDGLDFDCRLLRVFYRTAPLALQRRIAARVQVAGRVEYLTIIAGSDYSSAARQSTGEEAALLVEVLVANGEWTRLWQLVPLLPLEMSLQAVRHLAAAGWQPAEGEEIRNFGELAALTDENMAVNEQTINDSLQQAVLRAQIRVNGRVRALAFAQTAPRLAIATAKRKVALWNMREARLERLLEDFPQPIGALAFLPDGTLVCGERPENNSGLGRLYACREGERREFGRHAGAVTALTVLDERRVVSVGRDGRALVWDAYGNGQPLYTLSDQLRGWSTGLCRSADGRWLALLHNQIDLYEVQPDLRYAGSGPFDMSNSLRYGAFSPDSTTLVTGRFHGQLSAWQIGRSGLVEPGAKGFDGTVRPGTTTVEGLATLPAADMLILATSDGIVQYLDWPTRRKIGEVKTPAQRATAVRLSPDGAFMAVSEREDAFSLWDWRVLTLSRLFIEPLALAGPTQLGLITALDSTDLKLPPAMTASLLYIETALRQRYRFDVELADFAAIQSGAFDIEIEF